MVADQLPHLAVDCLLETDRQLCTVARALKSQTHRKPLFQQSTKTFSYSQVDKSAGLAWAAAAAVETIARVLNGENDLPSRRKCDAGRPLSWTRNSTRMCCRGHCLNRSGEPPGVCSVLQVLALCAVSCVCSTSCLSVFVVEIIDTKTRCVRYQSLKDNYGSSREPDDLWSRCDGFS